MLNTGGDLVLEWSLLTMQISTEAMAETTEAMTGSIFSVKRKLNSNGSTTLLESFRNGAAVPVIKAYIRINGDRQKLGIEKLWGIMLINENNKSNHSNNNHNNNNECIIIKHHS